MSIKEQREINQDHKGSYFREIFRKTLGVNNTLNRAEAVFCLDIFRVAGLPIPYPA